MLRKEFEKRTKARNGSRLKIGIVVSKFNEDITNSLMEGAREVLKEWYVPERNIHIAHTYGSFDLPIACQKLIKKSRLDAIVALGCIIKGETSHDVYIAHATFEGLMRVMLDTGVPIGLGVLTTNTIEQARARSSGPTNHGAKAAVAALEAVFV